MNNSVADFKVTVACSDDIDTDDAIDEIIQQCESRLQATMPKAGIVFFSIESDAEYIAKKITEQWPDLQLIGCSTYGELSSVQGFSDDSIVLTLFSGGNNAVRAASINVDSDDIEHSCRVSLSSAMEDVGQTPKFCFLLTDVLSNSKSESIVESLSSLLSDTMIFGGAAGDGFFLKEAKTICNKTVSNSSAAYLLLYDDLDFSIGVESGAESVLKTGVVTGADGETVYEIDHKPALQFYSEGFSKPMLPNGEFPLSVYDEQGRYLYARTCIGQYDEVTGSVIFLGKIPVGSKIGLSAISRDAMLDGVDKAISNAIDQFPQHKEPKLAVLASCAARRNLFGTSVSDEFKVLTAKLPSTTQVIGFYTYGEICPQYHNNKALFHNQTFASLLLG